MSGVVSTAVAFALRRSLPRLMRVGFT